MGREDIKKFFDKMAPDRDNKLSSDYIMDYEQLMRQRMVFDLAEFKPGEVILDIGCANARDLMLIKEISENFYGIDMSEEMISEAKMKLGEKYKDNIICSDAINLPFSDEKFDKIICSEVIEHIPDYDLAIKGKNRVLKPNGRLVITTPNMISMYGLQRILLDYIFKVLFKKIRRQQHPYDVWKRFGEVRGVLDRNNFRVKERLASCYLPGMLTYFLPRPMKKVLVMIVAPFEDIVRGTGRFGYTLGLSAEKKN